MDIVERLRAIPTYADFNAPQIIEHEAADEIERLREDLKHSDEVRQSALQSLLAAETEIERLHEALRYEENRSNRIGTHGDGCYSWGPSHYECAMREIERLREALQLIAAPLRGPDVTHYLVVAGYQDIARKALEGK